MPQVYVSLGSNIEPETNLCACLSALQQAFGDLRCSTIYQSAAIGFEGEAFLNAVVSFYTELSSTELKAWLKQLEAQQGRRQSHQKFSARPLDLDLLLYADLIKPAQKLPHPDILNYRFVLQPLAELAPEYQHPILSKSIASLAAKFAQTNEPAILTAVELSCAKPWQINERSVL